MITNERKFQFFKEKLLVCSVEIYGKSTYIFFNLNNIPQFIFALAATTM